MEFGGIDWYMFYMSEILFPVVPIYSWYYPNIDLNNAL